MYVECGGHKGGWMRIADLNTTRGDDCPSEWITLTQPLACVASIDNHNGGFFYAIFSTLGIPYVVVNNLWLALEWYITCYG